MNLQPLIEFHAELFLICFAGQFSMLARLNETIVLASGLVASTMAGKGQYLANGIIWVCAGLNRREEKFSANDFVDQPEWS